MLKRGFFSKLLEKLMLVSFADKLVNKVSFLLLHDVMNKATISTQMILLFLTGISVSFIAIKNFLILVR